MKWLWRLEKKFRKYAITDLIKYIVIINFVTFCLDYIFRLKISSQLILIPSLVLEGQIWRILTFIFIPPTHSILWILFILYFYYMIGTSLENEWGSFKFNIYYLFGIIGTIIAAFVSGIGYTGVFLNLSLFLAFAQLYPNYQILLFFILPVKVKYIAYLNWAYFAYRIIFGSLPEKAAIIASLINFFIFFHKDIYEGIKLKRKVYSNRKRFNNQIRKFKNK